MGAARAPQADVPRRSAGREDGARLLRVRREREEGTSGAVDPPELVRADNAKAALWGALAGVAQIASIVYGPVPLGVLLAAGYGLLLPVIAVLHVRHRRWRESGAILGTIGGTSVVVLGIVASIAPGATIPALFVRGVWWWTIGKMWWETALLPRPLGAATMALALGAFALAGAAAPLALEPAAIAAADRAVLGAWTIAVSVALWGSRDTKAAGERDEGDG